MSKYKILDEHLDRPKRTGKSIIAFCPFHPDKNTPNLSVFNDRSTFKCHSCGKSGSAYDYLEHQGLLPKKKGPGRPTVKPTIKDVESAHDNLLKNEAALKYLKVNRLWTKTTIKKFKLGIKKDYLTIPIYKNDRLVNIRLYDFQHKHTGRKFLGWAKGLGSRADLFPVPDFEKPIFLLEGEPDAILAYQSGLNATAFTSGVQNIKDENLNILAGNKINIVFDIDKPGRKAAQRITRYLSRVCLEVKNILLPITEPSNADFTDYMKLKSSSKQSFVKLAANTLAYVIPVSERAKIASQEPKQMHLEDAAIASNAQFRQKIKAIVAGKDMEPYLIPKELTVRCSSASTTKLCLICGLDQDESEMKLSIGPYDPEILQIVGSSQMQARGIYRRMARIPKKCSSWTTDIIESQNVDDLVLIPDIEVDADVGRPYVSRHAFLVGGIVETNRPYEMIGHTLPHPASHHIVHLIEKADPAVTAVDAFSMTPEIYESLKIFQPSDGEDILSKIEDVHTDLQENVTHIYGRQDMMMAIDLAYHSALKFIFQNVPVRRGWVEALIIGDTRTGKSENAYQLSLHYRAGEHVGAENLSYAGLVGGINQVGQRRIITWGKLPLNDGRLVFIDEFSGMDPSDIERLSGIRSSGVAEIIKIQTERTVARVRLVIMSNPRKLSLTSYSVGILAIKDLIGKNEDIARFDIAVALASDEVKPEEINKQKRSKVKHIYTSELCSNRVRWVWSRKVDQVKFTDSAVDAILRFATSMAKRFHSEIPLVEPNEQRIKLARLSVSMAAMVFSTKTGEEIIVDKPHVNAVIKVMYSFYSKASMGYDHYSDTRFRDQTIADEPEVRIKLKELGVESVIDMIDRMYIQLNDVIDWCDGDRQNAQKLTAFLMKHRCLKRPYSNYLKTPPFTRMLIKLKNDMIENSDGEEKGWFGK